MTYDLDGKVFRSTSNSATGDVDGETRFHYRQFGNLVTATYSGGNVVYGHLLAVVLDTGQLDMRYHHVNTQGLLMVGTCVSTPETQPDGRLKFRERWQWLTGDGATGESEIVEV
jgi:hypothetical protein